MIRRIIVLAVIVMLISLVFVFSSGDSGQPITTSAQQAAPTVTIRATDNLEAKVQQAAEGTTFIIEAGTFRLNARIQPKNNQAFIGAGQGQTILVGARALTNWKQEGLYWYVDGQTQQNRRVTSVDPDNPNICDDNRPRCAYPEDLFFNNEPLIHEDALAEVGAGEWYFDYDANRIYITDNPTNVNVETSFVDYAFYGNADNVTIRNLTVTKFATPAQDAAVHATRDAINWTVENVTAVWNHSTGINVGPSGIIRNCIMNDNGQKGVSAGGTREQLATDILIENNEIARNNWAGFRITWEAGGSKFVQTSGLIVRNNYVHHNNGKGLWTDIDNFDTLYEYNWVESNQSIGIYHELGGSAIIRNNTVKFNGIMSGTSTGTYYGQIVLQNSRDVEIYDNRVVVSADFGQAIGVRYDHSRRGRSPHGAWVTENNHIYNNQVVILGQRGSVGVEAWSGDAAFNLQDWFASENNRFNSNRYWVPTGQTGFNRFFFNGRTNWTNFQQRGQDISGQIQSSTPPSWYDDTYTINWAGQQDQAATPPPAPVSIARLTLINADTDQPIGNLTNGFQINLTTIGTANLSVLAITNPATVTRVVFTLDNTLIRQEVLSPYTMFGDNGPDYSPGNFGLGTHTLVITPYSGTTMGTPLTVTFTVIDQILTSSATPVPPTATPTMTPTNVPPTATSTAISGATSTMRPVLPTETPILPTTTPSAGPDTGQQPRYVICVFFCIIQVNVTPPEDQ